MYSLFIRFAPSARSIAALSLADQFRSDRVGGRCVTSPPAECVKDGPRQLVTLDTGNGIQYGINGSARSFGFPDVKAIQKPGTAGIHLQPFIDRGLTLCR